MSSHSRSARKKNRLAWLIPALVTLLLFFGGVSLEILSDDLKEMTKPYRKWVWTVFITSALIAIFMGIREWRKSDDKSESESGNSSNNQGNINIGDNAQNNQVTSQVENVGSQQIQGDKAGRDVIKNVYQSALPVTNSLHQLPSPPRGFVGRKKEIQELTKALEKSGVTISGLHGLGGVGKTALALKLAEQLKPRYPDAQFYLDLKGASKQPLSAGDAMAHVIRAYHPTAPLPEDESSLRGLYNSVLEGKRALLLMDNAASRQQIEPLVPPDSCVLLVTSRNRFTMNGLFAKNLDTLEPKDARDLLLKIAKRIGKRADEMAKLCGYLPLALELAASALSTSVNYTPEEYLQKLSKAKERLGLVEASLSLSYNLLNEEMQSLWRRLAIFPNTFDNAAAAAVWKVEIDEAQDRLGELITFSLVEWEETSRRYRLHDLLKLLADARLDEDERYSSGKLHAIHYRQVLAQSGDLYLEGGEKVTKGLALFDLERENIEVGQDWAAFFMDKEKDVTQLSMRYYYAAYHFLDLRLHPRENIRWLEISLKAARKLGDRTFQSYSIGNLGTAYKNLRELRKAIELHEQALIIAREIGDRRNEGAVLGNLGIAYKNLGEPRKAIEFFEQILIIHREIGDRRGEGTALWNKALTYKKLAERATAIALAEEALIIYEQIEHPDRLEDRATLESWKAESE